MAGKQAKILSSAQQKVVMLYLGTTRNSTRNRCAFLLSYKAGLRAKEIASLLWRHLTDSEGNLTNEIVVEDKGSKGKSGRVVPMNKDLRTELLKLQVFLNPKPQDPVFHSERMRSNVSSQTIVDFFADLYAKLGFEGASSHSGRRTFITNTARKITTVGGSLRDVKDLAGHSSLQTTQLYIDADERAKQLVVNVI